MSNELDNLVEQKVVQRLKAIGQEKRDADSTLRFFLALLGAGAGWWLSAKFGAQGDEVYWAIGIGAALGAVYEIVGLAVFVLLIVSLVKCVG